MGYSEDWRIISVTEELTAQDIYQLGEKANPFVLAEGTRMGNIHLSVKDSRVRSQFYQKVLGLSEKFSLPNASWLASRKYHHHLTMNEWPGKSPTKRQQGLSCLAYYLIEVTSKEELLIIDHSTPEVEAPITWLNSRELEFSDPYGIVTRVQIANK